MIEIHNNDGTIRVQQYSRPYVSPRPGSGLVRFNTENQCLEAYDGNANAWVSLQSQIMVDLDERIKYLLEWIDKKRTEEEEIDRLCAEYPNLAEARREFEILKRLLKDANRGP